MDKANDDRSRVIPRQPRPESSRLSRQRPSRTPLSPPTDPALEDARRRDYPRLYSDSCCPMTCATLCTVTGTRLVVTLVIVGAGCSGPSSSADSSATPVAPEPGQFGDCVVTVAVDAVPDEVEFERPTPWVTTDQGWYGGGEGLWVSLPPDGVLPALRADDGNLHTKFPWWRLRPGSLAVRAEPASGGEAVPGDVPDGYGELGFTPSGLSFPRSGCWRVTGTLDGAELSFVVWVCETDDYTVSPDDRDTCGAV